MSSISLGVAALVAIDSFSANTLRSIREQSRAMMGGDVSFTARGSFSPAARAVFDSVRTSGVPTAQVTTFASMATAPRSGGTRLAEIHAVSAGYPLVGTVETAPPEQWNALASSRAAVVDPSLLVALDARVGDTLALGYAKFVIVATMQSIPGDPGVATIIGPRVFISEHWVDETKLLGFGARAEYETLVRLPESMPPARWVTPVRRVLEREQVRIRTVRESESNMTAAIGQLTQFLGVVGLVAVLLGGIGVASGVHAYVQRKIDVVAILRCIGATSWQVLGVYVAQAALMGLAGAAAGAALGVGIQFALPQLIHDWIPVDVHVRLEPRALLTGLGIGTWVALVFALRPLVALRHVSPLATLRRDASTMGTARRRDVLSWIVTAGLTVSVIALAYARADSAREGFIFTLGIAGSLAVLVASAWLLTAVARRAARAPWPFVMRQGFANLHRPANQTQSVVIALGFGACLVSTLYLVQANLVRQFDVTAASSRGNVLFFDVQDDQRAGIDSLVRAGGNQLLESVPLVTMRIAEINGKTPAAYARAAGIGPQFWALTREYRSTYRDTMVATEKVVAGKFFGRRQQTDSMFDLSFDRDVAQGLKVHLGDTITWDVQGAVVRTRVTSLRDVNWGRFEPNFFAVFPPAALADVPRQHIMVASVPSDSAIARLQRQAVTRYPNVASIDLSLIRRTILRIVSRAANAVRFLALFSFAMGIPVLFSAVAATRRERLRESVLFKTLGATRRQVGRMLLSEYAALGVLGALAGMMLSVGGAWALMKWVFDLSFTVAVIPTVLIAVLMTAMAVGIGVITGREVFRATAMEALRE